ncbi:MAG TPA: hypothetical protein VLK37_00940 [Solirubrobacterales bacterium]|nr:hypothetical protein [Solirubrobacterales bacterium]
MTDVQVEIVGAVEVGPIDLRWEKKAEELEFEALPTVRGAAEKWSATLTAILGLVSTVLVVKGAEDVTKLSSESKAIIGVLLALALVAAFYAAYQAAKAAQGTPANLAWPSGPGLRTWEREQAKSAKKKLLESRAATGAAVLLMATAIALAWFGNQAESSGSTVLMTQDAGTPLCGSLKNGPDGLEMEIGSKKITLPKGPYDTVTQVDACPEAKDETSAPAKGE